MEGGKEIGEGSPRRKRQVERRSSRQRVKEPPVEEEVPKVAMREEEEERMAPVMNVEEERKRRAKAMKSTEPLEDECRAKRPRKGGSNKEGSGRFDSENASARPAATWCRGGAGRRDNVAGEMRARVSWTLVLAAFLAFPPFQRERVEEMGFGEIFRIERMRVDLALTQALRSRWDAEASAFAFPWGHMIPSLEDVSRIIGLRVYGRAVSGYTYPCYHDLAERLLDLPVERRSSLVPRVALQESLGLYEAGKNAGESEDEYLARLARVSRRELASEPGPQADLDLRRFFVLFLGRLLFATRGDAVHCRFLPLLEDLGEVWAYLYLPALGRGDLTRPGLAPIARRWDSRRDTRHLADQLERLQEAIDCYPYLDVGVVARAKPCATSEPIPDDAYLQAYRSDATTDDAYLQAYALQYEGKVYESARHQVDVTGEIASLRALLQSAVQDREAAQRQTAELQSELERVRGTGAGSASSSRSAGGSSSLLEARLAGAVLRAEEAQRHLEERERDLELTHEHAMELQSERDRFRGEAQTTQSERDQLRIRAEVAEAQVAEMARELAMLRVQRPPGDQEEVTRLRAELLAQQTLAWSLQQIVTDIGRSRSRSQSGASISRATGASVGQYLAGSSSRRRNEEEERRRQGEGSAQDGRGGGEMLPPPDRQEGSGESGGGQ
ncbi:hypothetical protein Taro_033155 [Colocasia esculenta]|uniref:Aminotransferase-like plant mobile domain-containing protein n=1 Tax=Colocasia esculenta TaxID=4460 RepID=A0A843W646_COLES|nr:hypothetical protein [Colocasia esculenta]